MEQQHFDALKELSACSFLPGSFDKRFVRDLSSLPLEAVLSAKQIRCLKKIYYRYRRQILARNPHARFDWTADADEYISLESPTEPRAKHRRAPGGSHAQVSAILDRYGKWTDKIADYWKG